MRATVPATRSNGDCSTTMASCSPSESDSTVTASATQDLPLLAIPHAGLSLPVMTSVQAAAGLCSILWLVDGEDPSVQADRRALERFGQVVDLAGRSPSRWVDAVAPFRPDGIVTFSDQRMVDVARLAEDLGLPFHRPEVALAADRQGGATRCPAARRPANAGLDHRWRVDWPTTPWRTWPAACDSPRCSSRVDGTDSRTTVRVRDVDEVLRALGSLFDGDPPDMVLEEYIADTVPCLGEGFANYVSVESIVSAGVVEHFAVTGRFPLAPPFRETGFFIPADLTPSQRAAALDVASAAVRAVGVETGCLHTEIKFTPDGPGSSRSMAGSAVASHSFWRWPPALRRRDWRWKWRWAVLRIVPPWSRASGIGFRLLFHAPLEARKVLAVEGLERVSRLPGARSATLHRPPGTDIDWRTGTNDYVYSVLGVADDYDQLRDVARVAQAIVRLRFEEASSPLDAVG